MTPTFSSRRFRAGLTALLALLVVASATGAIDLTKNGRPACVLLVATNATPAESTAAAELAHYLEAISGAVIPVKPESAAPRSGARIWIGATTFAATHGLNPVRLGPEEWVVRTVGHDVIIAGGRPRGTLYAAYHFLEDTLGVHWWNPFEESVPRQPTVRLPGIDRRDRPALAYRDIYMLYGRDGGRFAARNRLNRDGDAPITAAYGGSRDYGPPYHVHTFNQYVPPKTHFATHPEWYALIEGRRTADTSQLCLSNPELRRFCLEKLLSYIDQAEAAARIDGRPAPAVYSVSQNDCLNPCQCDTCQAIARAEESECGPLLDFVNALADGIKERHPDVFLDTLAYQYTQKAPKRIRPRDNVIIRLCDTESDPTRPITDAANSAFREHLTRWAEIARNLRVWDYAVTYANPVGMPMPTVQTYGPDFRFYATNHVEGVFTELEFEVIADLRDLKVWLMMKLLENPDADLAGLVRTFTDGFYGPAGPSIRDYLGALESEAKRCRTRCDWNSTPASLSYLNLGFVTHAQRLFDDAERRVGHDATLLRRVRHARLPLDRATLAVRARLVSDWRARGQPAELAPPDREAVARRTLDTWMTEARFRLSPEGQAAERKQAEAELRRYLVLPSAVPLPGKFCDLPAGTVRDYPANTTRNWGDVVKVVKDPEAESGIANRLDLTAPDVDRPEKYQLPIGWGLYSTVEKKGTGHGSIAATDIPGPGYHWYKMGRFPVASGVYAYFFWSWIVQVEIDDAFDPEHPDDQYEVWARVKFEGPRFPHARPGERDAICIERLVLVKTTP